MNISPCSSVDINCLKFSILTNENGASFTCIGIGFSLDDQKIWIDLGDPDTKEHTASIPFERLENWSIQLHSHF